MLQLQVPRSRSGAFQSQVIPRYQRRVEMVNQALREVFLLGVSTRQAGRALATLVGEKVSASTVSEVTKVLDESVKQWHQRELKDHYQYLLLDGISVRIRSAGRVQRRIIGADHRIKVKPPRIRRRHRRADDAGSVPDDEGHFFRRAQRGGDEQIALIFAVVIVGNDDDLAAGKGRNRRINASLFIGH